MRTPLQIASALLCAMLWTGSVSAAGLQVSPVVIELSTAQKNAIISLRNDGATETRYQANVVTWSQDENGQMKFAPTRDLVLFPQLLGLKPGEQRNLRVGVTPDKFAALEKTYRVFIEELPPAERAGERPAVQVLTRVAIPVFLEPTKAVSSARIEGDGAEAGKIVFRLRNLGNVRLRPTELVAEAHDASGKAGARERWDGWYVLAANDRVYEWKLPPEGCGQIRSVQIEARFERGEPVRGTVELPHGACPR
ncbi:MAG: molecular chaperone [Myxococcales bacterium]